MGKQVSVAFPSSHKLNSSNQLSGQPGRGAQAQGLEVCSSWTGQGTKPGWWELGLGPAWESHRGEACPSGLGQPGSCQAIWSRTVCVCLCLGLRSASQVMWVAGSCGVVTRPLASLWLPCGQFHDIWLSSQLASFLHGHFHSLSKVWRLRPPLPSSSPLNSMVTHGNLLDFC